jgi:hypothetical protein
VAPGTVPANHPNEHANSLAGRGWSRLIHMEHTLDRAMVFILGEWEWEGEAESIQQSPALLRAQEGHRCIGGGR